MSEQNNMHERVAGLKTAIEVVNELVDRFHQEHPNFRSHRDSFDEGYKNALDVIASTLELELDSCLEIPSVVGFLESALYENNNLPPGAIYRGPFVTSYYLDVDKISTLEEIREVVRLIELVIHDDGTEKFSAVRHLYRDIINE